MRNLISNKGFTLIELVAVIIIAGILTAVAVQQLAPIGDRILIEDTRQEMDQLSFAIAGNPELVSAGFRTDYGYIGDVGSLPSDLDALVSNPGFSTWNGPYIKNSFEQASDDYKKDAWQTDYIYTAGATITSIGSGDNIVRRIAGSNDDLLRNRVEGNLYDFDGTPPGSDNTDSVRVRLVYPDGSGGLTSKSVTPDQGGYFSFDSIPIGRHDIQIIYLPDNDTLRRFVSVSPGNEIYAEHRLISNVWQAQSPISGLVAHWKLDETSDTIAYDASGNGHHGALKNMNPSGDWVTGHIDGALDFDGSNDYMEIPYDPAFDLPDAYTVCGWFRIKWAHRSDYRSIITKEVNWLDRNWWVCVRGNGTLWWKLSSGGTQYSINPSQVVADDTWHHFAAVYDGATQTCRLYIDGTVPAGGTVTGVPAVDLQNEPVYISRGLTSRHFRGPIDDVRIYNRALTASEISSLAGS